jgi:hypothetical protein
LATPGNRNDTSSKTPEPDLFAAEIENFGLLARYDEEAILSEPARIARIKIAVAERQIGLHRIAQPARRISI